MALLPEQMHTDVFTVSLDGSYGRFKTADSFELGYLLTSLKVGELNRLETAAKAFAFRSISFEELIQRDIDYERVDNDLVKQYLEKGKDRVVFFPPLLVSLVAFENHDRRVELYREVTRSVKKNELVTTFDKDKFELVLNLSDQATGYTVENEGKTHNYLPYAATIRLNPQAVKLVVIDGQHRLVALQRIRDSAQTRHLIQDAEVPICVFFTPDAIKKIGQVESISRDLRELFVTINSKAKEVSGHFLVLLDDKSLSSHTVRALADFWKSATEPPKSRLSLLEWNTREARRANQTQKPYSITTVSTIASCLAKIFEEQGDVVNLLNLKEVQEDLRVNSDSPAYSQIKEDTFGLEQIPILNAQLNKYVTPSLDVIFLKPRPYREMAALFEQAVEQLEQQIASNTPGAKSYRDEVLYQFRQTAENDLQPLKDVETEFESKATRPDDDKIYFLNIFQQGLIRSWVEFCRFAIPELEITPKMAAEALVAAWDMLVFNPKKKLFDNNQSFVQGLLYEGQKLRVNDATRSQWKNLIFGSLMHKQSIEQLNKTLAGFGLPKEKVDEFTNKTSDEAKKAIGEYLKELRNRLTDDMEQNYRFRGLPQADVVFLAERDHNANETKREEFNDKIETLATEKVKEARKSLSNVLGIRVGDLPVGPK